MKCEKIPDIESLCMDFIPSSYKSVRDEKVAVIPETNHDQIFSIFGDDDFKIIISSDTDC